MLPLFPKFYCLTVYLHLLLGPCLGVVFREPFELGLAIRGPERLNDFWYSIATLNHSNCQTAYSLDLFPQSIT